LNKTIDDLTPKARRTRAAIIDAARSIIGAKGLEGMTIMDVCETADVGRTSFYNYFNDAESLSATVAHLVALEVREKFNKLHEEIPRGLERLEKCLTMILRIGADDPATALLLTSIANNDPSISSLLRNEICKELEGAVATEQPVGHAFAVNDIADFLTISTLATCRELALGKTPKKQVSILVDIMMCACRST